MKYSASVICFDPLNIIADVQLLDELGIDAFHIDVMDNEVVPRLGLYPEIVEAIAKVSKTPMDVHIMVKNTESIIPSFAEVETVERISVHTFGNLHNFGRISDKIRTFDKKPGVVLNLAESASIISSIPKNFIDSVLLMGINPGVLGGTAYPELVAEKLKELYYLPIERQVDGAVTFESLPKYSILNGNRMIVGSSTLFKHQSGMTREASIRFNFSKLRSI